MQTSKNIKFNKMRKNLKKLNEIRKRFKGTFERFGTKAGYKYPLTTLLFKDIIDISTKEKITEHIWFNLTKGFYTLDLKEGDVVEFDARVKRYTKGYMGYREDVYKPIETDYKLSHPTKIKKI